MDEIFAAAGGQRALAKGLGLDQKTVWEWACVPQHRLFAVAELTGLSAEAIRPDLAAWAAEERLRRRTALARERWGLARAAFAPAEAAAKSLEDPLVIDLLRLAVACRLVGRHRKLPFAEVFAGRAPGHKSARALACALCKVVADSSSTHLAVLVGFSRQNVDNAAERFMRACDGDDPEDVGLDGKVMERGRPRRAKAADPALWDLQQEFAALLAGEKGNKR